MVAAMLPFVGLMGGCPSVSSPPSGSGSGGTDGDGDTTTTPQAFTDASVVRGGTLYDNFWKAAGLDAPTGDHPLWASRPDTTSNTRTGADTWRCKECHGWDYKGVDGVYGSGDHRTGIAGIFGTTKTPNEIFDLLHNDHGYGDTGFDLGDDNIWDLVKFVLEGQIDTTTIIDSQGAFTGNETAGQTIFESGDGVGLACSVCHGADGLTLEFDEGEFLATVAVDNPWEFQHKVRFGQPGVAGMPSIVADGGSNVDVADLGAYSQTLPLAP